MNVITLELFGIEDIENERVSVTYPVYSVLRRRGGGSDSLASLFVNIGTTTFRTRPQKPHAQCTLLKK